MAQTPPATDSAYPALPPTEPIDISELAQHHH